MWEEGEDGKEKAKHEGVEKTEVDEKYEENEKNRYYFRKIESKIGVDAYHIY